MKVQFKPEFAISQIVILKFLKLALEIWEKTQLPLSILFVIFTAQKMKFSVKDFSGKCDCAMIEGEGQYYVTEVTFLHWQFSIAFLISHEGLDLVQGRSVTPVGN